jgi:hypothetical protein
MTTTQQLGQEAVDVDKPSEDDLTLWSVTTIIGVLDKPALLYWAAEQTANAAIDSIATWQAMLEDQGREDAVKWLRDARFRRPKTTLSDANLGTVVHKVCETYALTGSKPDAEFIAELIRRDGGPQCDVDAETAVAQTMLDQFDDWLDRFQPSYQATEVVVFHPQFGYAGQADAFLTIDGVPLIGDYKTSRKNVDARGQLTGPYPEVALQLAAYRHAQFAAVWRPRRFEKYRRRYYLLSEAERALAGPGARRRGSGVHPHHPGTLRGVPGASRRGGLRRDNVTNPEIAPGHLHAHCEHRVQGEVVIIDLQRRIAEIGRIRIGQQVANSNGRGKRPTKLTTFRLTSAQTAPASNNAAGLYGGTTPGMGRPRRPSNGKSITESDVAQCDCAAVRYGVQLNTTNCGPAGGCQRRCDGQTSNPSATAPVCATPTNGNAAFTLTPQSVMLRDLPGLGVWRIDTIRLVRRASSCKAPSK